jgi:hypothetical protein
MLTAKPHGELLTASPVPEINTSAERTLPPGMIGAPCSWFASYLLLKMPKNLKPACDMVSRSTAEAYLHGERQEVDAAGNPFALCAMF